MNFSVWFTKEKNVNKDYLCPSLTDYKSNNNKRISNHDLNHFKALWCALNSLEWGVSPQEYLAQLVSGSEYSSSMNTLQERAAWLSTRTKKVSGGRMQHDEKHQNSLNYTDLCAEQRRESLSWPDFSQQFDFAVSALYINASKQPVQRLFTYSRAI